MGHRGIEHTRLAPRQEYEITYQGLVHHHLVQEERMAKDGEVAVPHVVDLALRMALAAIASAGFGMDSPWRASDGLTTVCAGLGAPHRWYWWLRVLQIFYTALDHVASQVVQNAIKGALK